MQARAKKRDLVAENKSLRKMLRRSERELGAASARLNVFDEAAEVLGAAGLHDQPTLLAEAVLSGHVDCSSIFARFFDDQMLNVFHATSFTHRFKDDVKQWLAFCLTHPSPARVFDTLAGNLKVRSQMGLILPSKTTLLKVLKPTSRTSTSDFMGVVIPEQVTAYVKFQKEARRVELLMAVHAATLAAARELGEPVAADRAMSAEASVAHRQTLLRWQEAASVAPMETIEEVALEDEARGDGEREGVMDDVHVKQESEEEGSEDEESEETESDEDESEDESDESDKEDSPPPLIEKVDEKKAEVEAEAAVMNEKERLQRLEAEIDGASDQVICRRPDACAVRRLHRDCIASHRHLGSDREPQHDACHALMHDANTTLTLTRCSSQWRLRCRCCYRGVRGPRATLTQRRFCRAAP